MNNREYLKRSFLILLRPNNQVILEQKKYITVLKKKICMRHDAGRNLYYKKRHFIAEDIDKVDVLIGVKWSARLIQIQNL